MLVAMSALLSSDWLVKLIRRPQRERALQLAATWPCITAKLLGSKVVPKDLLAEEGTTFQTSQIESAFYFTLPGNAAGSDDEIGYYGGHLLSTPLSDSEAHRLLSRIQEDTPIQVRYNPQDPNQTHTLATDNPNALPFVIWSS
jgi:hypothetical protein